MATQKHHTHIDGNRNELRDWSIEKLAVHPAGADLYQGRFWLYTADNLIYYSPDGVNVRPIAPVSAQLLTPPKVMLDNGNAKYDAQQGQESTGSTFTARMRKRARVAVDTMSEEVLLLSGLYQPRLELLYYGVQRQRPWYTTGGTHSRSGWKHPDDMVDGPAYTDGWKGGGTPSYNHAATAIRRRSEWKITTRGEIIDVTEACTSRLMLNNDARYRDVSGNITSSKALVPVDCLRANRFLGKRKAWGGNVRDARVAFRVSIVDPNAAKPTRLYGPMSAELRIGSYKHPFIPDAPFFNGTIFLPTAMPNPLHQVDEITISFGTRLP